MSNNFIVSPYAISFESILNELSKYVQAKPESEAWVDFYSTSTGQTILELAAALGAMYSYQYILGRRESYLATAQNYSSIVGLAQSLGYYTNRGSNVKLTLNYVPNQTIAVPKWTIIGSYSEYDVVTIDDLTVMQQGQEGPVNVVIGNFLQESKVLDTARISQFIYTTPTISEDYRLLLNGTEVPFSTSVKDATEDKYVCLSNVYGGVDIFYLQEGEYKYKTGDTLQLQFIETNTLNFTDVSLSNFDIDYCEDINSITILNDRQDKESASSIRVKAPIHHETSMVVRSRKDYSKILLASNPNLISTSDKDIYPGLIDLTYIKNDNTFMSPEEKEEWITKIKEVSPAGVARAIISDPIYTHKTLNITLSVLANADKIFDMTTIRPQIDQIVSAYEYVLGVMIDFDQMEYEIERLDGIKTARVTTPTTVWQPNTYYELSQIITPTDELATNSYVATSFQYTSGAVKPTLPHRWADTVIDNDIIWQRTDTYEGVTIYGWDANKVYELHDYIKEVVRDELMVFEVVAFTKKSSDSSDKFEIVGNVVYDGPIIWNKSQKVEGDTEVYNSWQPQTNYKIGDVVEFNNDLLTCVDLRALSGATEPEWSKTVSASTTDNQINWMTGEKPIKSMSTLWNQYVVLDKNIVVTG